MYSTHTHSMSSDSTPLMVYILYMYRIACIHSMSSDSWNGICFIHVHTAYTLLMSSDSHGRVYILYMYTLIHMSMSSDSPEGYMFYTCTHCIYTFYEFRFSGRIYILYTCTHLIHIL